MKHDDRYACIHANLERIASIRKLGLMQLVLFGYFADLFGFSFGIGSDGR
jgi:hypothetical protein